MRLDRMAFVISMASLLLAGSLLSGAQRHASWAGGPGDGYYGEGGGDRSVEVGQESDEWDRRVREYNERLRWYQQRIAELTVLINRYRTHENDPDLDDKQRKHARDRRLELERERARLNIGMSGLVP